MMLKTHEFGAALSPQMLKDISEGKILQIELVYKMDITFNHNNTREHINSVQKRCLEESPFKKALLQFWSTETYRSLIVKVSPSF